MAGRGTPESARSAGWRCGLVVALLALPACRSTVDSVGYNSGDGGIVLHPLTGPATYPNPFKDWLGKSDAEIASKIAVAFAQLFHGDSGTQAIFFTFGTDQAFIQDVLHGDIRTEGIGWGMIVAVELGKRDEFDRLWRFAKASLEFTTGSSRGYFLSSCDTESGTAPCTDPFGMQQFLTALLFARDRWGGTGATAGAIDYGEDAIALLDVFRHKEEQNGGIVDNVTDAFDAATGLVFDLPDVTAAGRSRPSIEMPDYYELWAQASGDPFWTRAAQSARAYWKSAANATTGLMPVRATFDGAPFAGSGTYQPESYRAQISMALDHIWFARDPWEVDESNRLLGFFSSQGIDTYASAFSLGGAVLTPAHDPSLVAVNGMTAAVSTNADRITYVDKVWNLPVASGQARYYQGMLQLMALLVLGGQFQVW